jgi:gliding motility-associated-like protein
MNYIKSFLFILFICCLPGKVNAQYINVNDQKTPQQLVEDILVNSSCVSITNASGKGDNYTAGQNSFAYFNAATSRFPFAEGVVLTTSTSNNAIGPYSSYLGGGSPEWLGDTDLDQALGINSINATILEFDYVPLTDFLSFNYIFASNEYQFFYPCVYSDGFAFLIKEAGTNDVYKNLAVLPNTITPVSSTIVHPTIPPSVAINGDRYEGCAAINENYFNGLNNNTSPINYAGQTVVMNAHTNVVAGKKYHIKLVIADDKNRYFDSAVFLEAGSFASKIDFGPDQTSLTNNPVCFGTPKILNTNLSAAYSYKWYKDGVVINSANQPSYAPTESGTYKAEVTLTPSACVLTGEIKIDFAPEIVTTNTSIYQCDDNTDGISIFNLTKVNNIVKNNTTENSNQGFYETLANAEAKTNPILTPEKYTNKTTNQVVFARIENKYGCFKIAEVTLQISNNNIANQNPIAICDGDENQDGLYQFDLSTEVTPQVISGLPTGLTVNYFLNSNGALTETSPLPNIFKNTTAFSQTIYARIINGPDCYDIVPITLVVNTFDPVNFEDETQYLCSGDEITLSVVTGFSNYLWNTGNTANSITISAIGDYSVTVSNTNGCEKIKKYKILPSEPATITGASIKDFSANENSVLIEYTGVGNYEFSLDGITFQDEPLFNSVNPGIYNTISRDKNGCGLSNSYQIIVLDYPRFFTPNGDSYNDIWYVKNLDQLPDYIISIFDRYGKLVKQMNQNSTGWTGLFNGQQLPADDYWFTLILENGTGIKGHFSLKR